MSKKIVIIAHNIRSTHNVGSIFRTSDGFAVNKIFLTGFTPYPATIKDDRLPHISQKINRQIHKTALGAETTVNWQYTPDPILLITKLKKQGYFIACLEQDEQSTALPKFFAPNKLAIVLGEEISGVSKKILRQADSIFEIPMFGKKESFNVSIAVAIALYHFRYIE
jgi:tRNA G18 (ribose-2'-O)-methylase SpoU